MSRKAQDLSDNALVSFIDCGTQGKARLLAHAARDQSRREHTPSQPFRPPVSSFSQ